MKKIIACAAVLQDDRGRIFSARRGGGMDKAAANHWEFPGGKPEADETHEETIRRELREELAVEVEPLRRLATASCEQGGRVVELHFYACRLTAGTPQLTEHRDCGWFTPDELPGLDFAPVDRLALPDILQALAAPPSDTCR